MPLCQNQSYENVFPPPSFHFHLNQTPFRKIFALGLTLKQRHKVTQKWPILSFSHTASDLAFCAAKVQKPLKVHAGMRVLKAASSLQNNYYIFQFSFFHWVRAHSMTYKGSAP